VWQFSSGQHAVEFCKVLPSTGGFISFIGKTFGGRVAVTTALMTVRVISPPMASVVAIVGGFFQIILKNYNVSDSRTSVDHLDVDLLAFAVFMMIGNLHIDEDCRIFFAFERSCWWSSA